MGRTSWLCLLLVRPSLIIKTHTYLIVLFSLTLLFVIVTVITELDGLAKGQDSREGISNGAHARQVQERARSAVMFLEKAFEARDPCIRALTSRGNTLESIAFRSEDTSGQKVCFFSFVKVWWHSNTKDCAVSHLVHTPIQFLSLLPVSFMFVLF